MSQQQFDIDSSDPKLKATGIRLAQTLNKTLDIGKVTSVLFVALDFVIMAVIHSETTFPEVNIQAMHKMVDTLKKHIMDHVHCALAMNNKEGPTKYDS